MRWLSLCAAFACLVVGGVAFAAIPATQKPQQQKPFTARVYTSEPAPKPPAPKPEAAPKPKAKSSPKPKPKRSRQVKRKARPRATAPSAAESFAQVEVLPAAPASSSGSVGQDWEPVVQYYSGGSYGVSHINKLAKKAGNGGVAGDRAMVAAAASRYGIPFALLWGTYGAESSYGTNTGGGAKPPYFGLTQAYPGPPSSAYRGTSGNFAADAAKSARSWAKNYKLKVGRWPSAQAQQVLG